MQNMKSLGAVAALCLAVIPTAQSGSLLAQSDNSHIGTGVASYYGAKFAGNRTASGEIFDPAGLTAAHRTLPFGSRVRVTNLANGMDVTVRINDRGPFHKSRIIDISHAAASQIGMIRSGKARVKLELLTG